MSNNNPGTTRSLGDGLPDSDARASAAHVDPPRADLSSTGASNPPHITLQRQESDVPESGRSFPLAGGVANERSQPIAKTTTNEREPGTKEREAGLHEGQGREGLAGAAAAASSVIPQNVGRTEANLYPQTSQTANPEALTAASSVVPRNDAPTGANPQSQTSPSAHPEALAAATAATSAAYGWESHEHGGHGHKYEGARLRSGDTESSLLYTSGPHVTDTANRIDPNPKMHIPGEFPSPTPVEESNASSYLQSKPATQSNLGEHELRHTGSLNEPQSRSADPSSQHHYGRDAAVAGGLGAAGAGAYAAGKHHEKQSGQEIFPEEPSPYSSKRIDPRVDTVPRGGFAEQRYDPTASDSRSPRDAALTGGAIGTSQSSTQELPQSRTLENKEYPAAAQDVKSDSQHHYGRDAALVGAGAATTAGLYASQREHEPNSGPASSTIGPHKSNAANVLDPRVQPDPGLQKHHHAAPTVEDPAPSTVGPHKSDIANIVDPRVLPDPQKQKAAPREEHPSALGSNAPTKDKHHHGRDAAVAGGAGAAGYGAYEAVKSHGEHSSTQPDASINDRRYDPVSTSHGSGATGALTEDQKHHYGQDIAAVGGAGALGAGAYAATRGHGEDQQYSAPGGHGLSEQRYDPTTSTQQSGATQDQHHYGRDAAVVGGAGALGAGAYAATRGHDQPQQPSTLPMPTRNQPESAIHQRYDSVQVPEEDHSKRNAALGTAAGAGALGAGAYGLSQHDVQKEQERRLKEQQKTFDDQQKAFEKQQAHDQKHHDKLLAAEDKKHQKEADRLANENDQRLAAARLEQERRAKEVERRPSDEEGTPEKKHRFLTFLNKKDKDRSSTEEYSPRQSRDSPRHSKEYAAGAGAAGVAGAAAYGAEHDDKHLGEKHGRNVLHKDPPKGHPAALESEPPVARREHIGTDGQIGDPNYASTYEYV